MKKAKREKKKKLIKCECCGAPVIQERKWQKFCSTQCRFKKWQNDGGRKKRKIKKAL